jgi:hypothetical protein
MFGGTERWQRLGGLLPEIWEREPADATVRYYAGKGLDALQVRRFFLAAGVRAAGRCLGATAEDSESYWFRAGPYTLQVQLFKTIAHGATLGQ